MATVTLYPNGSGSKVVDWVSHRGDYPGYSTSAAHIMDVILNGGGDYNDDITQDGEIDMSDWSAYQLIGTGDDISYPLSDHSVAVSGAAIPAGSVINSVTVYTESHSSYTGSPYLRPFVSVGGTKYGAFHIVGNNSDVFTTRPAGGSWTLADITGLWAGADMASESSPAGKGHAHCNGLYVVVDYSPPTPVSGIFMVG
jgi:hypothetical protein